MQINICPSGVYLPSFDVFCHSHSDSGIALSKRKGNCAPTSRWISQGDIVSFAEEAGAKPPSLL
jgi:hypothetical protein